MCPDGHIHPSITCIVEAAFAKTLAEPFRFALTGKIGVVGGRDHLGKNAQMIGDLVGEGLGGRRRQDQVSSPCVLFAQPGQESRMIR